MVQLTYGHGKVGLTLASFLTAAQLLPAPQGRVNPLLHAPAAHPLHRGGAHLEGPG